jgi:hypothetical protein
VNLDPLKELLGPRWTTRLRCLARGYPLPRWGNLRRTRPFSTRFGFERGTPVDRFYHARFFERHRGDISGDVLEIQAPGYAARYGHALAATHSVDIDSRHQPTYLCDLARADGVIPSARYQCFLLPATLSHLEDLEGCLRQALRVVRPGGVVLASTSTFVPLVDDVPDFWRLSADGWRRVAARAWPGADVEVESHGNCLAAVAAMLGLAFEELDREELEVADPRYPVVVTLRARRRP